MLALKQAKSYENQFFKFILISQSREVVSRHGHNVEIIGAIPISATTTITQFDLSACSQRQASGASSGAEGADADELRRELTSNKRGQIKKRGQEMKEFVTLALKDIIPYERNPRKNDAAVDDVAESIRQVGYKQHIIVDENNVILAGHTRWKALQKLGWKEAEVQRELNMTEQQKRKYRLLDNKVGEKSTWDYELLDWELEDLDFEGYDFEFDIGSSDFNFEDMFTDTPEKEKKKKTVVCPHCGEEFELE